MSNTIRKVISIRFNNLLCIVATQLLFALCALLMAFCCIATMNRFRRLYSDCIVTPFAKLVLKIWRIKLSVHGSIPPEGHSSNSAQYVYISNHTSTLDLFILLALKMPNTRFFLYGRLRSYLPLGIIGYILGVFWTVSQEFPEKRTQIFKRAATVLKRTKESVYLSPEGMRVTSGEIGHFNKGAFHLAADLQVPIVPFYIAIPSAINPGRGWCPRPGIVDIYIKPPIATTEWEIEYLSTYVSALRELFIQWQNEHQR
jgi:1-acyl-sn-glycerol-3-phosphate acyltransferase